MARKAAGVMRRGSQGLRPSGRKCRLGSVGNGALVPVFWSV